MRRTAPLLVLMALLLHAGPAMAQAPVTHPPCPDAGPVTTFYAAEDRVENLAFDRAGGLVITQKDGRLLRLTPDGDATLLAHVVRGNGIAVARDGSLYVGMETATAEEIWRFTSLDPPRYDIHVSGLPANNGLAIDRAGTLYVSEEGGLTPGSYAGIVRVPSHDPRSWSPWSQVWGANGLALDADEDWLYAAVSWDGASRILRIDLADPTRVETVAQLSLAPVTLKPAVEPLLDTNGAIAPKGLDDLTLGPDGRIYVAAHLSGEVIRVDPASGDACALAYGLKQPTSVRFAHCFAPHDGWLFASYDGGDARGYLNVAPEIVQGGVLRIHAPGVTDTLSMPCPSAPTAPSEPATAQATPGPQFLVAVLLVFILRRRPMA